MVKPLPLPFWGKAIRLPFFKSHPAVLALTLFLLLRASMLAAQPVVWTDSFKKGVESTPAQCENWRNFLSQLGGREFVSVTISGTFDPQEKTMNDPLAATRLATLLATRTEGTVRSGIHSWTVTKCLLSVCAGENDDDIYGVALSYNGNTSVCDCQDRYAIRPEAGSVDWGGVNVGSSCGAESQTMSLSFSTGVSILVNGSTTICDGGEVELTAVTDLCTGTLGYLWSNGATSKSITVTQPGSYSVTITDNNGCGGVSETVVITPSGITVNAGPDVNYCDEPVQLNATGFSPSEPATVVNTVCIYNAPGGPEDCTFTSDVCLEGAEFVANSAYAVNVSFANPVELRYNVYYSPFNIATFRFKLNDHELGSFNENMPTAACEGPNGQRFPRSFVFTETQVKQYWIEGEENELSVNIETPEGGVYLAGITTEVVTSNEQYVWSPAGGLSQTFIKNPLASPDTSAVYTVTYTDGNGCSATDQIEVKIYCESEVPVAACREVVVALEDGCEVIVDAAVFDGGSITSSGSPLLFSASPAGPYPVGVTDVILTVTDVNGNSSACTTKITVTDSVPPRMTAPEDLIVQSDAGKCTATISLQAPESFDNCQVGAVTHDQPNNIFPVGETIVTWTAKDIYGNAQVAMQKIIVTNADPVINSVKASSSAVAVGKRITLTTGFSDNNVESATIDWGDSSVPDRINNPSKIFEAPHFYKAAGFFTVTVAVTDHCGATDSRTYGTIVVYDDNASVQGDGWFESEYGDYLKNPRVSGKAQFHFDAKYKNGWPTGTVSFKFKAAKIEFKSTQVGWLIVHEDRATLMASGKLNGVRDHSILISTVDGDDDIYDDDDHHWKGSKNGKKKRDQIRVRIMDPSNRVIYDTQHGEPEDAIADKDLGGGSIDVKRSKRAVFEERLEEVIDSYFGEQSVSVYPNPFKDWLTVRHNGTPYQDVVIQLIDFSGKVVASQVYPFSENGYYLLDVPERAPCGIYILVIKQGWRVDYLRLVRK